MPPSCHRVTGNGQAHGLESRSTGRAICCQAVPDVKAHEDLRTDNNNNKQYKQRNETLKDVADGLTDQNVNRDFQHHNDGIAKIN